MAMTMKSEGLDELGSRIAQLGIRAQEIASAALYDGAGVMAGALKKGVNSIETESFKYAPSGKTRKPSPQEKAALQRKVGIAKFHKNGSEVDTLVGMGRSGYCQISGKKKPVIVVARSINSGTSFMEKQPVIRKAITQNKAAAEAAIVAKADAMINEITKA